MFFTTDLSRQQEPVEKKETHLMDFMAPVYQIRKGQELMSKWWTVLRGGNRV